MPIQAQDITNLRSLIPPKLGDYQAILLIRTAIRHQHGGLLSRVECQREIEAILGRVR